MVAVIKEQIFEESFTSEIFVVPKPFEFIHSPMIGKVTVSQHLQNAQLVEPNFQMFALHEGIELNSMTKHDKIR